MFQISQRIQPINHMNNLISSLNFLNNLKSFDLSNSECNLQPSSDR